MQRDSFDRETVNKLWDAVSYFVRKPSNEPSYSSEAESLVMKIQIFFTLVHVEVLQIPRDEVPNMYGITSSHPTLFMLNKDAYNDLKGLWFDEFEIPERLDMIEILVKSFGNATLITNKFNSVFRELCVSYRVRDNGEIIPIDNEEEHKEVEEASKKSDHINKAIKKLYDRKNPDHRNSIKESMLAVEEMCNQIGGDRNFNTCIEKAKKKFNMHSAFVESLKKMYGFCSDEKGVRHSGNVESDIQFEEARLILVWCSAVVNYLKEKQTRVNI